MTTNNIFINPLANFSSPILAYNQSLDQIEYYVERFCISTITQTTMHQWDEEKLKLLEENLNLHFFTLSSLIHSDADEDLKKIARQMVKKHFDSQKQDFFYTLLIDTPQLDIGLIMQPSLMQLDSNQKPSQIIDAIKHCRTSILNILNTARKHNHLLLTQNYEKILKNIETFEEQELCLFFTLCTNFFHPEAPIFKAIIAKTLESLVALATPPEEALFTLNQSFYQLNTHDKNSAYVIKSTPFIFVLQFKPKIGKYHLIHVIGNAIERDVQYLQAISTKHSLRAQRYRAPIATRHLLSAEEISELQREQEQFATQKPDKIIKMPDLTAIIEYNEYPDHFEDECLKVLDVLHAVHNTPTKHLLDIVEGKKTIDDIIDPQILRFCCALQLLEHSPQGSDAQQAARALCTSYPEQRIQFKIARINKEIEFIYCIQYQDELEFSKSLNRFKNKITSAINNIKEARLDLMNKTEKEIVQIVQDDKNDCKILAMSSILLSNATNSFFTQQLLKKILDNHSPELFINPHIEIIQGCFSCQISFHLPQIIKEAVLLINISDAELEQKVMSDLQDAVNAQNLLQKCKFLPESIEAHIYGVATKYYYNQESFEKAKFYLSETIKLAPDYKNALEFFAKINTFDPRQIFEQMNQAFRNQSISKDQILDYEQKLIEYKELLYMLYYQCAQYYLQTNEPCNAYIYLNSATSIYPNSKIDKAIRALHQTLYKHSIK
ncbi:hypothetical protein Sarmat_00261 [Rickettsiales endosymbiont of Paramecium tredecaurelia]|uniref:hypothetical protein n=1 Tax=Candidatus Sarmatiella mevalonica TaxID=2770581 RepID=UPI00192229A6|nr:hypothetical protein [Candidatus Sarmatiella mevalonica]MBL3284417.1 hypothetical protein [Candidatus Sarmatiella mevalonica]